MFNKKVLEEYNSEAGERPNKWMPFHFKENHKYFENYVMNRLQYPEEGEHVHYGGHVEHHLFKRANCTQAFIFVLEVLLVCYHYG